MIRFPIASVLAVLLLFAGCNGGEDKAGPQSSSKNAPAFGIVLMHGKGGTSRWVESLAADLRNAGYVVETPLLPWGQGRKYDRTYQDALLEVDQAVEKLKAKGAKRIVIGGHSLGANVALGYAVNRKDVAGVMMLAPGHLPSGRVFARVAGESVARAKRMITKGEGNRKDDFADINQGREDVVHVSAKIYLSWFDPSGPASMRANATRLSSVPVLWVGGHIDRLASVNGPRLVFQRLPDHKLNRLELIDSDHLRTPGDSTSVVLKWLKELLAATGP